MDTQTLYETPAPPQNRRKWTMVAVAAAVTLVIVAAVVTVILIRSDDGDRRAGPTGSPAPSAPPSSQPSGGTTTPSAPPVAPSFGFQPLWPFAGAADAAAWQQSYRSGGHQPWHLDPAMTALSFTQQYLGYRDVDQVVSTRISRTEAWIGVGYSPQPGRTSTAAVLHLARIGSGSDAPWEVVGTRDTTLSLTKPTYGAKVVSPVTVGGRVTGVDESLVVQLRTLSRPVLARSGGLPAGGQNSPWSTSLAFTTPPGTVLTIAVATGGHVQDVERFAITGAKVQATPTIPAGWKQCTNLPRRYSIGHPGRNSQYPFTALSAIQTRDRFDAYVRSATNPLFATVTLRQETTVGGARAVRLERIATGEGLHEKGRRLYDYAINRNGLAFVVSTTALPENHSYDSFKRVVDQTVGTLRFF